MHSSYFTFITMHLLIFNENFFSTIESNEYIYMQHIFKSTIRFYIKSPDIFMMTLLIS